MSQLNRNLRWQMQRFTTPLRSPAACACLAVLVGCAATRVTTNTVATETAVVAATDIDRLTGAPWRGTLTYLDYTSHVQTTIKSSLKMTRLPEQSDGANAWNMSVGYTDEPHANSGETAVLARRGRVFRGANVLERTILSDGLVRVVTEQDGEDDGRAARLRFVYVLGEKQCSLQKLVRLLPDGTFFERHIYRWSR